MPSALPGAGIQELNADFGTTEDRAESWILRAQSVAA
jgi:hypothetical protein